MSKHTPGPWLLEDRTAYALNSESRPVNRFWCQVERGWTDQRERTSFEEVEANARLIAAAPELLEALCDMLGGWKYIRSAHGDLYGVGWDRVQEKAVAAIAKATGEQG